MFFHLRQEIPQSNAKTRRKFAGTYVALVTWNNVEIASKGGELDRSETTLAMLFTLRLSIVPTFAQEGVMVGIAQNNWEGEAKNTFRK
jgi:hypothetical protein